MLGTAAPAWKPSRVPHGTYGIEIATINSSTKLPGEAMVSRGFRNQRAFTLVDALVTFCIIGVLFGIFITKYPPLAKEAQETALRSGLFNIRSSIRLFRIFNGRNPKSLKEMVEKKVILPARVGADASAGSFFDQKYLMDHSVDKKGNIVDSFGNPVMYDPLSGAVRVTTKGYEHW